MRLSILSLLVIPVLLAGTSPGLSGRSVPEKKWELGKVVAQVQNRLSRIQGLSLDIEWRTGEGKRQTLHVTALRPNMFRVEGENQWFMSDGKSSWQYFPKKNAYCSYLKCDRGMLIPFAAGFSLLCPPPGEEPVYSAVEETVFEGKRAIALVERLKDAPTIRIRVFLDPESWLPVGSDQRGPNGMMTFVYGNVRVDRHYSPADFSWTPPRGAVDLEKAPVHGPQPLQAGQTAPDFELPLVRGGSIRLRDALVGRKGALVNFWFIGCGGCEKEMPEIAALARDRKDLLVITVNPSDRAADIAEYLGKMDFHFPVAIDKDARITKAFGVNGYPTTFLLRPDLTVAFVQVGYEKESARLKKKLAEPHL